MKQIYMTSISKGNSKNIALLSEHHRMTLAALDALVLVGNILLTSVVTCDIFYNKNQRNRKICM